MFKPVRVSDCTEIALYADDTKIWRKILCWEDHEILQRDINSLYEWSQRNKMKFHPQKCKVLTVSRRADTNNNFWSSILPFQIFDYNLNGTALNFSTESEIDLGVLVTPTFSWNNQCLSQYSKSSSRLGLLKRTCHFVKCQKQKRLLYLAVVCSQYEHCSIVWRPTSDDMLHKLESVQKRAVKWILNECNFHYSDVEYICRLKELNLLPIKYHFILSDLVIFQKVFYDNYIVKLPTYLRQVVDDDRGRLRSNIAPPDYYNSQPSTIDLSNMRSLSLDSNSLKCTVEPRAPAFKNSFFFRAHMLWNYLPQMIRQEENPVTFKRLLRSHLWDVLLNPD